LGTPVALLHVQEPPCSIPHHHGLTEHLCLRT
jgi:hypothetical protein